MHLIGVGRSVGCAMQLQEARQRHTGRDEEIWTPGDPEQSWLIRILGHFWGKKNARYSTQLTVCIMF